MTYPQTAKALCLTLLIMLPTTTAALAQQKTDMGGMAMKGMTMSMDAPAPDGATGKVGDIEVSGGYVRAMLPGQPVGGGYITIRNGGKTDDRLTAVTSSSAGKVDLHEMKMNGNVMQMRELKDGVAIAAGATVTLSPNGLHMMFSKVTSPFKKGETVPVTLTFEKAGSVQLVLPVKSVQGN